MADNSPKRSERPDSARENPVEADGVLRRRENRKRRALRRLRENQPDLG